ncbi:MAG: tRNA (N6-isopentenyl adenosine(37)-C2)-methylthiotransferase MiaB [Elusimicrobiota bacterium]
MNEADSELMAASFIKRGFKLTDDLKSADAVVVNTCTVRQRAEDKAISQIGRLRVWKKNHPEGKIFIAGCAAQKLGGKHLKHRFPFVDEVIGAKSIDKVDATVEMYYSAAARQQDRAAVTTNASLSTDHLPLATVSNVSAYVTAMRGCSLKCTYCIVPEVRGPASYLPPEEILADAASKAAAGAREIILLGQTVNAYAYKTPEGTVSFADLLSKTSAVTGVSRVRFMSPHPLYFNADFFRVFRDNPKIARYVHLPVQSGSDRILKAMRRGYTRAEYLDIVAKIREAAPEAAVSTDFIVGYPGETEADFKETLSLVAASGISFAYCFKYSQRTDAAGLAPDLGEAEMEERLSRLLAEVKKNSSDILNKRIGRIEEVLLEAEDFGRTSANFIVRLDRKTGLRPGSLIQAEITGVSKNTLKGRLTL